MAIWDFITNLNTFEQILLLLLYLGEVLPFIAVAVWFKRSLKVGRLDTHGLMLFLGIFLVGFYFIGGAYMGEDLINDIFFGIPNVFALFIGASLFGFIFNRITGDAKKTYIIEIQMEEMNFNLKYVYTYEQDGLLHIIHYNEEMHESFGQMLRRLRHRDEVIIPIGHNFEWTANQIFRLFICTEYVTQVRPMEINGKVRKLTITYIKPIPAVEFSQIDFLVRFRDWNAMHERLVAMHEENSTLRMDVFFIAKVLVKKYISKLNEALVGAGMTIDQVLEKYSRVKPQVQPKLSTKPFYETEEEGDEEYEEEGEEEFPYSPEELEELAAELRARQEEAQPK